MSTPEQTPACSTFAKLGFWLLIGLESLFIPVAVLIFSFGVEDWAHASSEDVLQMLVMATYPVWVIVVAVLGHRQLKRANCGAAYALGASPMLVLIWVVATGQL